MADNTLGKPRKGAIKTPLPVAPGHDAEAAKADQYIDDQLKAIYDAVIVEPIPDRLMQLLDRLDGEDAGK